MELVTMINVPVGSASVDAALRDGRWITSCLNAQGPVSCTRGTFTTYVSVQSEGQWISGQLIGHVTETSGRPAISLDINTIGANGISSARAAITFALSRAGGRHTLVVITATVNPIDDGALTASPEIEAVLKLVIDGLTARLAQGIDVNSGGAAANCDSVQVDQVASVSVDSLDVLGTAAIPFVRGALPLVSAAVLLLAALNWWLHVS